MKIKKIARFIAATGWVALSCSKLDLAPTDAIDPTKAFRNLPDVNMGVLGAYAPLTYTLIEAAAIVSDEVMLPTENTVSNTSAHRWLYNSSSGSVTSAWNEYYVVIDRINHVLEAIPAIQPPGGKERLLNQYQGELLALRAYSHFELLRAYASSYDPNGMGVPYMKHRELGYPSRPSVGSNFEDIHADLKAAKDLIPPTFDNPTRITQTAVSAMQARVALYQKDWKAAITYATEAISAEPLAPKNDFNRIWKGESQSEVIWQLARVVGDSRIGAAFFREAGEIVLYAPSFKLINQFGAPAERDEDIRFASYIRHDPARQAASGGVKSAYLVQKYVGGNPSYPGLTPITLFRTGEMYLIRAEAYAEDNNNPAGANDLNTLRAARIHGYAHVSFANKEALIDAIYKERFKELAFEGHRFFDLKRRNLPVERLTEDAINTSGAVRLDPADAQYCFPLPADEIAVNRNIEQNPEYQRQ